MFKVGQRVTVKQEVGDEPDSESPGGIFARPGEILVVRNIKPNRRYPVTVSHELSNEPFFGVALNEIEAV